MSLKKIKPILQTVGISAVTSLLFSAIFLFVYFRITTPAGFSPSTAGSAKTLPTDAQATKYEAIINSFLDTIRKGQIETAYKGTSPIFQKKTTLDDFKKLIKDYESAHSIPSSPCSLTEYSEPFSGTITGLTNTYMIAQTKCETTEKGTIKGFGVEFIDDAGKPKISFINAFTAPVTHKIGSRIQ